MESTFTWEHNKKESNRDVLTDDNSDHNRTVDFFTQDANECQQNGNHDPTSQPNSFKHGDEIGVEGQKYMCKINFLTNTFEKVNPGCQYNYEENHDTHVYP